MTYSLTCSGRFQGRCDSYWVIAANCFQPLIIFNSSIQLFCSSSACSVFLSIWIFHVNLLQTWTNQAQMWVTWQVSHVDHMAKKILMEAALSHTAWVSCLYVNQFETDIFSHDAAGCWSTIPSSVSTGGTSILCYFIIYATAF